MPEIFSAVAVGDAGIFVDGKVANMRLVQHGIRVVFQSDKMILVPALGIGFLRVINQSPAGVGGTAAGIRIVDTINRRLHGSRRQKCDLIQIISAIHVALQVGRPNAVRIARHGNGLKRFVGRVIEQQQANLLGGRRPQLDRRRFRMINRPQVVVGINNMTR